jgi:acetyl coenzyme A synthetase (ADP forming)-like protein
MTVDELDLLFNPGSVAVIGATDKKEKWFGSNITKNVLNFQGGKYLINKNESEVFGFKTYKSIKDVPDQIDTAVIVIPAQSVPEVMEDCAEKDIKTAVIITAGFREADEKGARFEEEIVRIARRNGIRFVGPNCVGIFDTGSNFGLTPYHIPRIGNIGLISQSGNLGGYMIRRGSSRGLGFSKFVSSGNEADLNFVDYLEYLARDPKTKVIAAYVEGLKDGRHFIEVAKNVTKEKPVVILKAGRTGSGSKAARSHTGALAGSDSIYDAAFKQTGVLRVEEIEDLFDVAAAFTRQPIPKGKNVGVLTVGGGFGVITADACERCGLSLPQLLPQTIEEIDQILPSRWPHTNPVDMVGEASLELYQIIDALFEADNIDSIITSGGIGFWSSMTSGEDHERLMKIELERIEELIERMDKKEKPLLLASLSRNLEFVKELEKGGLFTYPTPERAVKVLSYMVKRGEYIRDTDH